MCHHVHPTVGGVEISWSVPTAVDLSRRPWVSPDGRGSVPTAVGPSRRPLLCPDSHRSVQPCPFKAEKLTKFLST